MTLYQKVMAVFSLLRNSIRGKVDNSEFAPSFSTSTQYAVGTLVMKDGVLYACTSAHQGEWNPGHFLRTVMSRNIPTKTSDLSNDSGFIGGSAIAQSLGGIAVKDDATQKEVRVAVQSIIAALKSLGQVSCIALALLSASAAEALNDGTLWEDVSPTNKVKDVVEKFSPPADFSTNNQQLAQTILAISPSLDRKYAMFIIPVNDLMDHTFGTFTAFDIELKASTNNFASSGSGPLVFYYHTSTTASSTMDGARLYVENRGDGDAKRKYTYLSKLSDIGEDGNVTRIVVIVSADRCRRTNGAWLHEDNEEVLWTFARMGLYDNDRESWNGWTWRPIAPVRWFDKLPKWAQQ